MTTEPIVSDESADPQREAVYDAESYWSEMLWPEPERLMPEHLAGFAARVLSAAGWQCDPGPSFVLDVPDESGFSGWYECRTRVIHLHPKLLSPMTVLHELAHWLDNRDGHGARFCANHIELVSAALGELDAKDLLSAYIAEGAAVDRTWLADTSADPARTTGTD